MTDPTTLSAATIERDLATVSRELAKLEVEMLRRALTLTPDDALIKLLSENLRLSTKAGGPVDVWINGKTRILKAGVALGTDFQLSVTTPKSGKWRVLQSRGFGVSGPISHTRALAIFAKIFQIGGE